MSGSGAKRRLALLVLCALAALGGLLGGCGGSGGGRGIPRALRAGARPIGRGPRFQPAAGARVSGACKTPLGRRQQAHVEIFAANRVVLLAAGIGARPPRRMRDGRITHARCFGDVVTLDPTGTVYLRPGGHPTLADVFTAWGQPLSATRMASFTGGSVRVYVDGRRVARQPADVQLRPGTNVVLEIGPHVPPHSHFAFPPLPDPALR